MEQTSEKTGKVSALLENLTESATLAMARMGRELAQKGFDVVSLSLGEPDFNTPEFIKEAARQALDKNITHYPPVNGFLEVRQAISKKFLRDNDLRYSADQIVISTGAKQSIANAILALVNPGDEVIMPSPYWVSYAELVKIAGGIPVEVLAKVENDFKITPIQLREAITPRSKLVIYSSPSNPTGTAYSRSELEDFASVIKEKEELYVISDEIYELINFNGKTASIAAIEGMADRTITVNGVSKAFAMTGWRIGYIGAPKWIADACSKMQGQITSGANSIAQMATKAAVEADTSVVDFMVETFRKRRDLVYHLLKEIPGIKVNLPDGAFYFFPDVSAYFGKQFNGQIISSASDLSMYLLKTQLVAVVAGEAFGDENCIRISYAASEEVLREAIARIAKGLNELK
ncbi:MAG: pyridoxal phosphate-dependent aminotransferase [Crocinitomicaceae bacterium]|nr:pyridoxal phosphate-dependent aminotransferase [Crocinitomicaceae bacterium]